MHMFHQLKTCVDVVSKVDEDNLQLEIFLHNVKIISLTCFPSLICHGMEYLRKPHYKSDMNDPMS